MKLQTTFVRLSLAPVLGVFLLTAPGGRAQMAQTDNSGQNSKTSNQTRSADHQTNAAADRETTAKIRRAVIADKSLSIYAHNVKILVSGGKVTLKGPVHSEDEKTKVAAAAASVVSADAITNQLTVKP